MKTAQRRLQVSITISPDVVSSLNEYVEKIDISRSLVIERAIREYLENHAN